MGSGTVGTTVVILGLTLNALSSVVDALEGSGVAHAAPPLLISFVRHVIHYT